MNTLSITNSNVFTYDWATKERQAFLAKVPAMKAPSPLRVAPGLNASMVWGEDVSGGDLRSVKALLNGSVSFRSIWWNMYQRLHTSFSVSKSTEHAMYDFHKMHHDVTMLKMSQWEAFRTFVASVKSEGWVSSYKTYMVDTLKQLR